MSDLKPLRVVGLVAGLSAAAVFAVDELAAYTRDLWVHPRNETYDPAKHYRAADGELYYKAENDITDALGDISLDRAGRPLISVELGPQLLEWAETRKGSLVPVLRFDTDADHSIDRTVRGRIDGARAVFDSPRLEGLDLRHGEWQMGILYVAGADGEAEYDGRYLASVDSEDAQVAYRRIDELAPVGVGTGTQTGLVILKHREGEPFDFADFLERPSRYTESFDRLTRAEDEDAWTVEGSEGRQTWTWSPISRTTSRSGPTPTAATRRSTASS
jgi:hypothetical protein